MSIFANKWEKYWSERKVDWVKSYGYTWNHPHRQLIIDKLKKIRFGSLLEVGCACGPNLIRIQKEFPNVQLGGADINQEALEVGKLLLPQVAPRMFLGKIDKLFYSDKASDVVLTDMALIYAKNIDKCIKEIKRVARNYVILVEFHSKSWWKRLKLKLTSGYGAFDYQQLLEKNGFYNVMIDKIEEKDWPGGQPQKDFAYIITANL